METMDNSQNEPYIDEGLAQDESTDTPKEESVSEVAEGEDLEADETHEDAHLDSETEDIDDAVVSVFERDDWADKVITFKEEYPIAKALEREIGDCILENDNLWSDENCLEKALIRVLSEAYMPDEERATDEEFLEKYIYNNEAIKGKIVGDYMEELESSKLPRSMTRGGRIPLVEPRRPRTISEAGALAAKIMGR